MGTPAGLIEHLEAGLRAASLKQKVIANNIANIDTPGFHRKTVDFDRLLAEAMREGGAAGEDRLQQAIVDAPGPANENGNTVDLDVEVGELIKNASRYKTYCRMLSRLYRQMDQAMAIE